MNFYDFNEEDCNKATNIYREYYKEKGMYENRLFDGVLDLLKNLKNQGKIIALATSKPKIFAIEILKHFEIYEYFSYIGGSDLDGILDTKEKVIKDVLINLKIEDTSKVVMIGDRKYDMIGASNLNIDTIGVLFGYGTILELEKYNPKYIAETVEDLSELLISKKSGGN